MPLVTVLVPPDLREGPRAGIADVLVAGDRQLPLPLRLYGPVAAGVVAESRVRPWPCWSRRFA